MKIWIWKPEQEQICDIYFTDVTPCDIQVVPAGSVPSQESGGSSPMESGGESGSEGKTYRSKEQLMLRANSLKKALRQIIEQAEKGNPAWCSPAAPPGGRR